MSQHANAHHYKAGEVAKLAGLNVETLRYYEREGLLSLPQRSDAGYRLYPESSVQHLLFIKRAKNLGFTLAEIKTLLALSEQTHESADKVRTITQQKLNDIDEKLASLHALRERLCLLLNACPGEQGTVETCPIIHSLDTDPTTLTKGGEPI